MEVDGYEYNSYLHILTRVCECMCVLLLTVRIRTQLELEIRRSGLPLDGTWMNWRAQSHLRKTFNFSLESRQRVIRD